MSELEFAGFADVDNKPTRSGSSFADDFVRDFLDESRLALTNRDRSGILSKGDGSRGLSPQTFDRQAQLPPAKSIGSDQISGLPPESHGNSVPSIQKNPDDYKDQDRAIKRDPIDKKPENYDEQYRAIKISPQNLEKRHLLRSSDSGNSDTRDAPSTGNTNKSMERKPAVAIKLSDGKVTEVRLNEDKVVEASYSDGKLKTVTMTPTNDALGARQLKIEQNEGAWNLTTVDKNGRKVTQEVHNVQVSSKNGSVTYDVHIGNNSQTITRGPDGSYKISPPKALPSDK